MAMMLILLVALMTVDEPMTQERAVELAITTLRQQLEIAPAQVQLQRIDAVDWRDTSLGCPEPGMIYAQIMTPGFRIVLAAAGKTYPVHVGAGRAVVCVPELAGGKAGRTHDRIELVRRARERVAAQLQVDAAQVHARHVEAAEKPARCAEPSASGPFVVLEYQQRHFVFDAGSDTVRELPCAP